MWVWFAPIGVAWVKWWIGMVGRGYFLGIFWHGGLAWWDVFLGIFYVDRFIRGQIGVLLGVFGRFSGYFRCIMGFFGYFLG